MRKSEEYCLRVPGAPATTRPPFQLSGMRSTNWLSCAQPWVVLNVDVSGKYPSTCSPRTPVGLVVPGALRLTQSVWSVYLPGAAVSSPAVVRSARHAVSVCSAPGTRTASADVQARGPGAGPPPPELAPAGAAGRATATAVARTTSRRGTGRCNRMGTPLSEQPLVRWVVRTVPRRARADNVPAAPNTSTRHVAGAQPAPSRRTDRARSVMDGDGGIGAPSASMEPDSAPAVDGPVRLDRIERAHLVDPRDASHVISRYRPAAE